MCVLCVMYIVVQVVSCTGTSLLVTDSYPHSMPCISNEYLPIHHIACSTLALLISPWPPWLLQYVIQIHMHTGSDQITKQKTLGVAKALEMMPHKLENCNIGSDRSNCVEAAAKNEAITSTKCA